MASHCSRVRPWAWRRMASSCARWLHLVGDQRLGHLVLDQLGQGLHRCASRSGGLGLRLAHAACRRSRIDCRSSSTVSNSEFSAAHSSSASGRTRSFTSLTSTRNRSSALLVGVGVGGVELEDVAGLGAVELLVDLGDDGAWSRPRRCSRRRVSPSWASPSSVPVMSMATASPSAGRAARRRRSWPAPGACGRSGRRSPRR